MPLSFAEFLTQVQHSPMLQTISLLSLAVLLVNGWTDAPNAITGVVVTEVLSYPKAILLAASFNFLGVLCVTSVNASVAETIYSIADFGGEPRRALGALCASMTAIVLWATAAWLFGIPTSESHALVSGITGAAIALEGGLSCVHWEQWGKVLLGLFLSSFLGFAVSRQVGKWMTNRTVSARQLRFLQIPGAALLSFLHGAQDGQKFIGIFVLGSSLASGQSQSGVTAIPLWMMLLCAAAMAAGTSAGGRRIIDTVGREMTALSSKESLSADLASIPGLLLSTLLGLPVSTTHARISAVLGAGSTGKAPVNCKVAERILFAWLATFPICTAIGYFTARVFLALQAEAVFRTLLPF